MQKVEIIFLPFATKRLPRYLRLSKVTIGLIVFSLVAILVLNAYVLLNQATIFYHQWQASVLDQDHKILLEKVTKVKEKILCYNQALAVKEGFLKEISLITETRPRPVVIPAVLNQQVLPWDEKGYTTNNYLLTHLVGSENFCQFALAKVDAVWDALKRLDHRLSSQTNWAKSCRRDMQKKYYTWSHTPSVFPSEGVLTCGFGARRSPFGGPLVERHSGVDIAGPVGLPIKSTADGSVLFAGWVSGYGNLVIVDHQNGFYSYYGHCALLKVVEGQKVKRYQSIALLGSTGRSTGPHVHFEIRNDKNAQDPMDFVESF